ncbi:PepSY domain-containing protein [Komagataeibacter sp. FNDCF1]|uniref:PepSY-associated TM helix domain-containing protein n=1 Tax=Komagataeibacter sp. FNDCF1 TaxID=2878681 RepID=UPI001E605644|nr:PepSY-associated TM helix domain-containing protein [Komagataeibacter sp. FNDCF1]MCE2563589.1 PepSY domain-containing protein [Komagataeibacter sp. FNDCF1]
MMRDTLRLRMGWLHAWVGFMAGILLLVVFAGGTLAVFDTEITRWMQPENLRLPGNTQPTPTALEAARHDLEALRAGGEFPFLSLPSARDPMLRLLHYDGHEFIGPALDPLDGQAVAVRQTVGGQLFYNLHFTLWLGHDWGRRVVDGLGLAMIVATLSGVIIHLRALLPDLVVFRPFASRARAWLDVHVVIGVFFLPFIVGMAYTGVVIHSAAILPDGAPAHRRPPAARADVKAAVALPPLAPILNRAAQEFGTGQTGFFLFNPNYISAARSDGAGFRLTRDEAEFRYDDGMFLRTLRHDRAMEIVAQGIRGFHYARWTPPGLRWLYFLSGLGGTVLIASGLVLFLMRHRRRHGDTIGFRMAEAVATAVIVGFPVATLGLFWANRLLPATLPTRLAWEGDIFVGIWLASMLHACAEALARRPVGAWRWQLRGVVLLGMALPVMDILTRPGWAGVLGNNVFCAVDGCALGVGAAAMIISRRLAPRCPA